MNFKTWQTYVLIGIVVAHLLIVPGLLICSKIYPRIAVWQGCIAYSQCALLAVFAAFSRVHAWKRWGLFFAGLIFIVSVRTATSPFRVTRLEWYNILSISSIPGLITCGMVVCLLPIQYWIHVDDRFQPEQLWQFNMRDLLTATSVVAFLLAWYRFGMIPKVVDLWELVIDFGLYDMGALGFTAALFSTNHRLIGVAVVILSIAGLSLSTWGTSPISFDIKTIGIIAVTILLWRIARIPTKLEGVSLPSTPFEQTVATTEKNSLSQMSLDRNSNLGKLTCASVSWSLIS